MIDHETALLATIAEAPADPCRNGIYADWLQSAGATAFGVRYLR